MNPTFRGVYSLKAYRIYRFFYALLAAISVRREGDQKMLQMTIVPIFNLLVSVAMADNVVQSSSKGAPSV
jgi:hypothetical protein